nr:integrase, catalytic region, zinc finger, CCHC-type, peptidase aspartic, catalytic [Tanacetum cinerariifolium]
MDNDIYSTVDACPNACEMWKATERADTDDKPEDQELEAHYLYMAQIQKLTPDTVDSSGPIFDAKPLPKIQNDNNNYNVFANDNEHPKQPESVNATYPDEQGDTNILTDSLDVSNNEGHADQDEDDDLSREHEVTNLQCDYLELLEKCKGLEIELSKSKMMSKMFELVQKHAINLELELQQCKEKIKNDMLFKVNKTKDFCKERKQYFEIHDLKAQLQDKGIVIRVILTTSVSRPQLKSNPQGDIVMHNNSQGKKQEVEDQRRNVKFSKNKTSVTACNDSLNAKTLNVKSVCATCDTCVLIVKHDMCVLKSIAKPIKETVSSKSNKKPRNFTRKLYERVNLEVAFRKSTCYIRDLKENDLLTGSHGTDLYSITLQDTNSPNPICLIDKATSSQ